jgi:putative aldouronate transport system permease protein
MGVTDYLDIRGSKEAFRHLYTWSGIWQSTGWSTIIYVSALSGVPDELHEAAKIDGASRLRRVFSVDFPTILPTVALLLIMRFGSIMSVGYQKAYLMQNGMNIDVSELISTYVYKQGIKNGNMSFGTAIGLLNSVINTALVFLVNWITNLLSDNELGMF